MESEFKTSDTKIIKGVAILLMLIHHMWGFPERLHGDLFSFVDSSVITRIGSFGKICVSLFFFVGGYGIYELSKKKDFNIFKHIKKIYLSYWKVFVIFIPIAFIFFSSGTYYNLAYDDKTLLNIVNNFLGLCTPYNSEWWFLLSYIFAVISFPFLKKVFDKNSFLNNIFIVTCLTIVLFDIIPGINDSLLYGRLYNNFLYTSFITNGSPYIACFWMGIVFAKDNGFYLLKEKLNSAFKLNIFSSIVIILICYFLKNRYGGNVDFVIVPFFIIAVLTIIKKIHPLEFVFNKIGYHSTNMWLIHSFFLYYFYPFNKIIMMPMWCVSCLIFLIIVSYIASLCVDVFWKKVKDLCLCFKEVFYVK